MKDRTIRDLHALLLYLYFRFMISVDREGIIVWWSHPPFSPLLLDHSCRMKSRPFFPFLSSPFAMNVYLLYLHS